MLDPIPLGLKGLVVGSYYLFEDLGSVVTIYKPRVDTLQRNTFSGASIHEAGTIRLVDFRAFFCMTDKGAEDF